MGYKFGKWIDVAIFERMVGDRSDSTDPAEWNLRPQTIGEAGGIVEDILKKYESAYRERTRLS